MKDKKFYPARYFGKTIFQEAKLKEQDGFGYRARRFFVFSLSEVPWHHLTIEYGIRWSDKLQLFPVWNSSHNGQRALLFGLWKLYFEISYYRKQSFNQKRKYFMRNKLRRFYQLVA
jgi:hypothetical protein